MSAAAFSTVIEAGSTFRRLINIATSSGDPVDLSGYTARAQVRESVSSPTVLAEWTTQNGRLAITNGTQGEITWLISATETAGYTWPEGVWDLELVAPSGEVERLLEGRIVVSPEVTR